MIWEISFLPEESTQEFILGVFKEQSFEIGNKGSVVRFVVKNVEAIPMPEFKEGNILNGIKSRWKI